MSALHGPKPGPMDYAAYMADFNTGDDEALVETWFAPDCVMNASTRVLNGRSELLAFLRWAHDGVREIVRPRRVLQEGDRVFVDVDMDFVCTRARLDFPFAPLSPGDVITVRFFVTYWLAENGQIRELNSMTWPAGQGVIAAPLLSGTPGGRAAYAAYAAAFSASDMERAGRYYTEDCTLELPSVGVMRGRQAILDFYQAMFQRVRETLEIHHIVIDEHGIAVDCTSTFTALVDAPEFVVKPLAAGEAVKVRVMVLYALTGGLISSIKVARAGVPG